MRGALDTAFEVEVWRTALGTFGSVAQLSVMLYDAEATLVCGPVPATPVVAMFQAHRYDPGIFADCLKSCLAQPVAQRAPVVVTSPSGLAAVGVSLLREGRVAGAVVGGYALAGFSDSIAIARLARDSRIPFQTLWDVTRVQRPVPARRLIQEGALLQVLADTLLRENDLRRRSETSALEFAHLASHDPLTDLPNRALLAERLADALALAHRHERQLAVLYLDVDHFKSVNDSLGHPVGDELLRAIAHDVTMCVRASDTVSRFSGDEFVVVLSELRHAEDAAVAAQNIALALGRPRKLAGHEVRTALSIGISVYPNDGEDAQTLLRAADMALYRAKELRQGGYQFFTPDLTARAVERRVIETGLHRALERQEFELVYQPKLNLKSGAVVGAEALIRWQHPDRGLVGPDQFVTIAEDCGLITPIGRWVVREACRQTSEWRDAGLEAVPVSVNVSAVEFQSPEFVQSTEDILKETGMDARYLEIELTESVLMPHVEASTKVLSRLKTLGVQLAIDDFGTGWSSLSYLRHFPIDALKVDRSFVQEIRSSSSTAPIISAVISIGKSLNLRVIAEGVETREQLAFLRSEDCAEGQGYLFARPVSARQFARVLETGISAA